MRIENGKGEKTLILAHGAGAGMNSAFMNFVAEGIAKSGIRVIRFQFPYMNLIMETGKRRPPNSSKILIQTFIDEIKGTPKPFFIGGKSMGGRIASMIADQTEASGVLCMGYPFHPPGKPEKLRTEHLRELKTNMLILQGERDPFGKKIEVKDYELSQAISLHWLIDGDHSLKPRKASGKTQTDNWNEAIDKSIAFMKELP